MEQEDPFKEFGGSSSKGENDPFAEFGGTSMRKKPSQSASKNTGNPLNIGGLSDQGSLLGGRSNPVVPTVLIGDQRRKAEQSQKAYKPPVQEKEPTFTESIGNTFENIGTRLQGVIPRLNVVSADLLENTIGKEATQGLFNLPAIDISENGLSFLPDRDVDETRNRAYETLSILEQQTRPTQGLVDNIRNFNIPGLAAGIVDATGQIASTAIPSVLTGGAGLYTETIGDAVVKYNEEKAKSKGISVDKLYKSGQAELAIPGAIGTISGALENIGLKGAQNLIMGKIKGSGIKKVAAFLGEANKEGLTEWVQTGLDKANEILGKGEGEESAAKNAVDEMFSKKGIESYLMGVVGSGAAGGVGRIANTIINPNVKANLAQKEATIERLQGDLMNPEVSESAKEFIAADLQKNVSEVASSLENQFNREDLLTEEQNARVDKLTNDLWSLQSVIADQNVSAETKTEAQAKIDNINEELQSIKPEKQDEIQQEPIAENTSTEEVVIQPTEEGAVSPDSIETINETSQNNLTDGTNEITSPTQMDVGEQAGNGEGMGEGNTQEEITQETAPEVVQGDVQEVERTALKNEDTNEKRAELGFDPIPAPDTKTNKELVEEAKADTEFDADKLVDDILNNDKPATGKDVINLKQHQLAKESEVIDLGDQIVKATQEGNATKVNSLIAQRDKAIADLDLAFRAGNRTGTLTARDLQARKAAIAEDYSLGNMISRAVKAKGNKSLTKEEQETVIEDYNKLKTLNKQYEDRIKELEANQIDTLADKAWKKLQREVQAEKRKSGRQVRAEVIDKSIEDTLASLRKKVKKQQSTLSANPIPIEAAGDIAKLAKLYIQKGALNLEQVVDNIYTNLKDEYEGLNTSHIKEILALTQPTSVNDKNKLETYKKRLSREIAEIKESIKNNEARKKKSPSMELDEEAIALKETYNELKEELDNILNTRLEGYKARISRNISDTRERINQGDFSRRKLPPIDLDEEAKGLRDAYEKLKFEYDTKVERERLKNQTPTEKLANATREVSGLFRALKATADLSALLRQGGKVIFSHPYLWFQANKDMLNVVRSNDRFDSFLNDIKYSDDYQIMKDAGLEITDKRSPKLEAKEEDFQSNIAEKLPILGNAKLLDKTKITKNGKLSINGKEIPLGLDVIGGSDRAYTGFLTSLRVKMFRDSYAQLEQEFKNDPGGLEKAAKARARDINNLTGRADIGKSEKVKALASVALFSPRWIVSNMRVLTNIANPFWYQNTPKVVRKMFFRELAGYVASVGVLSTVASMIGYSISLDPYDNDFLKLKDEDGKNRIDLSAGTIPYIRQALMLMKIAMGQKSKGSKTKLKTINQKGLAAFKQLRHFGRGKLAPLPAIATNLSEGSDFLGEDYGLTDVPGELVPLAAGDVTSSLEDDPALKDYVYSVLKVGGMGISTYKDRR